MMLIALGWPATILIAAACLVAVANGERSLMMAGETNQEAIAWGPIIAAGISALSSYAASRSARNNDLAGMQMDEAMLSRKLIHDFGENKTDRYLEESKLNPFRAQEFQAGTLSKLDRMKGSNYTPFKLSAPSGGGIAGSIPQTSGGFTYQRDPQMDGMLDALFQNVAAGNAHPSSNDLLRRDKPNVLDLFAVMAGRTNPRKPATGKPQQLGDGRAIADLGLTPSVGKNRRDPLVY